jgi:hypothetical protein
MNLRDPFRVLKLVLTTAVTCLRRDEFLSGGVWLRWSQWSSPYKFEEKE